MGHASGNAVWQNQPSTATPVNAAALERLEAILDLLSSARYVGRTAESFGCVGDGVTDDSSALNSALASGGPVVLTPGKTYAHASVLTAGTAGTTLTGLNATLLATAPLAAALHVTAANVTLIDVYHTVNIGSTGRQGTNLTCCPFAIDACAGAVLIRCTSEFSAGSGFFWNGASNFLSVDCVDRASLADGHHVTYGSHDGTLVRPVSLFAGDDMFANVSYTNDPSQVQRIRWVSPRGQGQGNSGRGFTVVGAAYITGSDVHVTDSWQAGLYVAAESGSFNTLSPSNVTVYGATLTRCNLQSGSPDQGGILLYAGFGGSTVTNVNLLDVQAVDIKYVKAGNNGQGAAGSSGGGTFSACKIRAKLSGLVQSGTGTISDVGLTGGGVDFSQVTTGGQWSPLNSPIYAVLAADAATTSTSQNAPASAFNMNYLGPGTYDFEIEGLVACSGTGAPVFNFGNNQGNLEYISYCFPAASSGDTVIGSTSSNSTATGVALAGPAPFRIRGTVIFTSTTGNNVWSWQVGSSVAGQTVTIKAGALMRMQQVA